MRSALVIALLGLPAIASAHIHLMEPLSRTDDPLGDPQKMQHCGDPAVTRTARVTTFKPGETITVTWKQTIAHPGWYRISFQPNGETFRIPPASNGQAMVGNPPTPQASNMPTENLTGMMDPGGSGSMILKDRIPGGTVTTTVTLPNMECANCTLQIIQVMTNNPPYTTDAASNDIYFNCADITLANAAPDAGVDPMTPDAGNGSGSDNPGTDPGMVSGGCSTDGIAGWPAMIAVAGLIAARRRRRA